MHRFAALFVCALAITLALPGTVAAKDKGKDQVGATVIYPTKHDVSAPLASIPPESESADPNKEKKEKRVRGFPQVIGTGADTAVQSSVAAAAPATLTSFEGLGQGFSGPGGTFLVNSAPADTNGAVGPNHFVQIVNTSFAVFSKTGTVVYGPAANKTLWAGFGGECQADNDGDATVVYDQLADRWVVQQFAVFRGNGTTIPYFECLAVSTSGDPTGTYNRYAYQSSTFPDYPKLGVWPDAYYLSTNDFQGNTFVGASAWAFDRAKMLAGDPTATAQVAHLSNVYGGLLPSSLDGKTPPPAGSPDYFLALGTTTSLFFWTFHVDFANAANSTFTGPTSIPVAGYTELCNGGTCVPQSGTTQQLDSVADRLMYRLAYRNFGDHEALLVTHSVAPGTGGGIRWYEIRSPAGTPSVFQQSTYAPDTRFRWMPSASMDGAGNIGVGYSLSSSAMHPAIAYTGRLVTDPLNTLQAETLLIQGNGSQTASLARWGDYSSMFVDPTDDCTFWYTTEYLNANGTFNWHTRVGTFKFANCPATTQPPTVSGVSPASGPTAGGTAIAITGTNFAAGATVTVGGTPATGVSVVSATQVNATTPAHAAGVADVVVTVGGQSSAASPADVFTYVAPPPPTVTGVSPTSGPTGGGTAITITGTDFDATATVSVGGTAATGVSVVSATQITATTPAHAPGAADVVVTVGGQSSATSPADVFTYIAPPPPTVTGVSPTSGPTTGGTAITISGTNFDATATVTVGGAAATGVSVISNTQINATTPTHAAGTFDVIVTVAGQPTATNPSDQFTYITPPPTVSAVSPSSGPTAGGTAITIAGTGFEAGATVTVGGTAATGVNVVSATQINATAPAHVAGAADVVVTVNGQSSATNPGDQFTYVAPPSPVSVSPASGSTFGGTSVTITGTDFRTGATVTFGGTALTSVTVVNANTINGTTASHAAGAVDVVVRNGDGQSGTCTGCYSYVASPPVISNVQSSVSANRRNATITWTTNIPADGQVEYGTTTGYGSFSPLNGSLVTSHSITLSGLSRGLTYHYRVYSRNSLGELTVSGDFTFTTR